MEIELDRQERPGRRLDLAETWRFPDNTRPGKTLRCQPSQGFLTVRRACKNRNGNTRENALPILPVADLREIVGPHQPHKIDSRPARLQRGECVDGEMRAESGLEIEDADAPIMLRNGFGARDALAELAHAGGRLQRILRCDQPPDFIEAETLQRLAADMQMALMRRVERAAKQADVPLR